MKLLNFIMKLFGTIIGVITAVYVVALYMDLTLRFGVSKNNISILVDKVDLIEDSKTIFETDDRVVERAINDFEISNLTYEEKKEIIYNSKIYEEIKEYLTNNIYYFVGYSNSKYTITNDKKEKLKHLLINDIEEKTGTVTEEEKEALSSEIDRAYNGLENINFGSLVNELPSEYKIVIDHINSTGSIYVEVIVLIFFLIMIGMLMKDYTKPFKWLSIGLLFSSVISVILYFISKNIKLGSIILGSLREVILSTIIYSMIISMSLCVISFIVYIILKIKYKDKLEDDMGKTRINIEKINI
ncbi:MAG: hypothetical protein MRZ34_04500 [Bacillales bacterium]|nr:hypothetical protein [Bacillales bacterium]